MRISTSTKYIDEQLFQNNSPQAIQDFKNKYKLENFLTTLDFYPRQGNRMVYSITYQGQDVSGKEWDLVVANAGWIYGNNNSMTPYMQRIVEPATNMITKTKWQSLPDHYKASFLTAAEADLMRRYGKSIGIRTSQTLGTIW